MQQAKTTSRPSKQVGRLFPRTYAAQPPAVKRSEEPSEDLSKAIVCYRPEGVCQPHHFSSTNSEENWLGEGAYGVVYKVQCALCHKQYAKKTWKHFFNISQAVREKHIQNMDMELRCYMTLDHPNILSYVHHELSNTRMQIYTEFCQLGDLGRLLSPEQPRFVFPDLFPWLILEGLASALARCHHGLKVTRKCGTVHHYAEFEKDWRPILHRDIKPGNVLVATEDTTLITKLGDFGTSYKLDENAKAPSTLAGTRSYWAPEIHEEFKNEGRITKWSMESDIWGVGAVLCQILTPDTPQGQPKPGIPQEQPNYWKERVERLQNPTQEGPVAIPRLLVHVVSECLSPSVHGRPSALQLLAVVMKSDTSSEGVERSESFWKVIATQADPELASSVVTHFVSKHLRLLDGQPIFSLLETTLIMSLAYKHCPNLITQCHRVLCNSLLKDEEGELVGSTAFHVIAWLHKKDDEIARLAFEDSGWPFTKALSRFALRKNEAGLLPSALAALQGKKDLCVCLTKIEERARVQISSATTEFQREELREELRDRATREFEFMFSLLTQNVTEYSIPHSEASRAMIRIAQHGFSNVARKLVELGIDPSIRGSRSETVLHIFALSGDVSMVLFLLEARVNVDARDNAGRTPLHWAAWSGQDGAVNALLSSGADINATDARSRTALYGAAGGGFTGVVSQLISRKADLTIRGGRNKETPLERARKNNHIPVIDLLSRNMNR